MFGLPFDLVEDTLSRVPARSLKRLGSTCKQWNELINDHRFTKKHSDKAPKEYLNLLLIDFMFSFLSVDLRGLQENIAPSIEVKGEVSLTNVHYHAKKFEVYEVFHCDGLLLCTDSSAILVVWNPCTGQTRWIQTESVKDGRDETYALGYEYNKSCRNYKILRFLDTREEAKLEIYELKSNSWRILDSFILDFEIHLRGVSVNGNTYWVAADKADGTEEEFGNEFLISFDFTTEKFGPRVALPYTDIYALSSVREERLAVLFQDEEVALTMEIWMTDIISETKAMSWSRFLKIGLSTLQFLNRDDVSFSIDVENKVAVCCDEIFEESWDTKNIVYIIGDVILREVDLGKGQCWPRMFSYVPSLVQI